MVVGLMYICGSVIVALRWWMPAVTPTQEDTRKGFPWFIGFFSGFE